MDGTTRAAEHCYSMFPDELFQFTIPYDSIQHNFDCYWRYGHNLYCHGMLDKRWLILPLNVGLSHGVFYAFLNLTSIGEDQNIKFTAYFKFDSDCNYLQDRDNDIQELDENGVISFLDYLVYKFGSPSLGSDVNIRNIILDPSQLLRIYLDNDDNFQQGDGCSCGIYLIMSLVNFCCSTAYLIIGPENLVLRDERYFLPLHHWLDLFVSDYKEKRTITFELRETVRDQFTILFSRLDVIKKETFLRHARPTIPKLRNALPKMVTTKMCELVYEIMPNENECMNKFITTMMTCTNWQKSLLLSANNTYFFQGIK